MGRKFTCIKLGELSFEALRFALGQHELRIINECVNDNMSYPFIKKVKIETEKMLKGVNISLNRNMNNFIGIRGSGKSSLLEIIRYVLELEPKADEDYKKKLVEAAVGSGGKITMEARVKGTDYIFERIYGEGTKVYREGQFVSNLKPLEVLPVDNIQYQIKNNFVFPFPTLSQKRQLIKNLIIQDGQGK